MLFLLASYPVSAFSPHHRFACQFVVLQLQIDDDDASFYRDLEEAKRSKLGGYIPKEQVERAALDAQEEFLAAMKDARKEFNDAKQKLGSKGAVELFLDRIRKEDEMRNTNDDDVHGEFQ